MSKSRNSVKTLVDKIDDLIAWMEKYDDDLRRGIAANTCTESNQETLCNETNNLKTKANMNVKVNCLIDLIENARQEFGNLMTNAILTVYNVQLTEKEKKELIIDAMTQSKHLNRGDFCIPCFRFSKLLKCNPIEIAENLMVEINTNIYKQEEEIISSFVKVDALKGYLNIYLKSSYLGSIVDMILDKSNSFLNQLPWDEKRCNNIKRVMVEYSQPNTHKALHVGHIRNIALGDCVVRLYEHCGYSVIAANYFGDEGAHVAKCLWLLDKKINQGELDKDLDKCAPVNGKGEWLGAFYVEAVNKLSLNTYTLLPFRGVIAGKVVSKTRHPNKEAATAGLHIVELDISVGKDKDKDKYVTVVCGGTDYETNDYVPYVPVGGKFNGKNVVSKDIKGVSSCGIILGVRELGINLETFSREVEAAQGCTHNANEKNNNQNNEDVKNNTTEKEKQEQNENKKKQEKSPNNKMNKGKGKAVDERILILSKFWRNIKSGDKLINIGRIKGTDLDDVEDIELVLSKRDKEQRLTLKGLENEEEKWVKLWQKTRQWCVDDFHKIYDWLDARFDHDFCESECSKPSRELVNEFYSKDIFVKDNGAIGIHLDDDNLGFCVLLKSDGSGLYATKDLALAQIKFDKYKIDKSIYVVDSSQSHHFKQVFATLKAMNYKQAENCFHLAYSFVSLPQGRMAARKARVVLFSELKQLLIDAIGKQMNFKQDKEKKQEKKEEEREADKDEKNDSGMTDKDKKHALRLISVGTIRYGMLNHDPNKEIVFDLDKWIDTTGNTGPYLMYQCTRVSSIIRNVEIKKDINVKANYQLLNNHDEKILLYQLSQFQNRVQFACDKANPSALCNYLYTIAQAFSAWFSKPENNIKKCNDNVLQITRLNFVRAIGCTLTKGLSLLGIQVLDRM